MLGTLEKVFGYLIQQFLKTEHQNHANILHLKSHSDLKEKECTKNKNIRLYASTTH